ncbi:CD225/dispanin family protein [Plantactinospora sp. CA-290183]|uniref:CD225/dispanin family protein n=1 Tax=Plantactinospora sp. CA-290183 TaxID=3240006 RepID=UPI003D90321C
MHPGYPGYEQQPPQQINNNMTMSIVAIFLFWPLAIPAIMNASKVNPLLQQGDYAGAQAAAAESRKWSKLALIIGIAWIVLWTVLCCVFAILGGALGGSSSI